MNSDPNRNKRKSNDDDCDEKMGNCYLTEMVKRDKKKMKRSTNESHESDASATQAPSSTTGSSGDPSTREATPSILVPPTADGGTGIGAFEQHQNF